MTEKFGSLTIKLFKKAKTTEQPIRSEFLEKNRIKP
jgi:hypothetical protein